jgi:hypothetical protein
MQGLDGLLDGWWSVGVSIVTNNSKSVILVFVLSQNKHKI